MTTERYFPNATAEQLNAAAQACWEAAFLADDEWDAPIASEARRLTAELGWSWDFTTWSAAAAILEREADLASTLTKYTLKMREECGGSETIEIEAEDLDEAREMAEERLIEWVEGGDYGSDGAAVTGWWKLLDEDGDVLDEGRTTIDIEPDHDALVRAAGGDPDCEHDWTSEGEGGLDENPGVWSVGGTAMVFRSHCRLCGLQRRTRTAGAQRNPGEHDTVEYHQPETWCPDRED